MNFSRLPPPSTRPKQPSLILTEEALTPQASRRLCFHDASSSPTVPYYQLRSQQLRHPSQPPPPPPITTPPHPIHIKVARPHLALNHHRRQNPPPRLLSTHLQQTHTTTPITYRPSCLPSQTTARARRRSTLASEYSPAIHSEERVGDARQHYLATHHRATFTLTALTSSTVTPVARSTTTTRWQLPSSRRRRSPIA